MKPSVAIIGTRGYPSYYGGFETAVRELAPYLVDAGWDVSVYGRSSAIFADDPLRDARVNSVLTRGVDLKSISTLSYGFTAAWDASRRKPDVALIMNVANGYFLRMLKRAGIPTVVNVDGIEWERAKWGTAAKNVFKNGARLTAKHGDFLVYDADAISRRWQSEYGRSGTVIPYGGHERPTLNYADEFPAHGYVLLVARFVPENSVPEFLTASEEIAARWPVVIVGSSGYGGELDERAEYLSRTNANIHWLGHISDDDRLHSLWQNAGVYFHGHSVGGTNPTLVQAMALGAPTVARDTVYNREVLGDLGIFASPDRKSIVESISRVMSIPFSEREVVKEQLRARARDRYGWGSVCSAYERLLRVAGGIPVQDVSRPAEQLKS